MSKPLPTIKDVARHAGVSVATVSYVINGRGKDKTAISERTRQRVLDAVANLGYIPNQNARHLRSQRTERICLVLPRLGIPAFDVLVHDVQRVADTHDYTVMIALGGSPERERQIVSQLQHRFADGAIIVHGHLKSDDFTTLTDMGLPLVVFHNHVTGRGFDVVHTNEAEACDEAVSYLLKQGRRRIAFLGSIQLEERPEDYDRFQSYLRVLRAHDITIDEQLIRGRAYTRNEAHQITQALLRVEERPDAIFAASDVAAISAIWAIRDAGLRVPEDIAVIGVGNIAEGKITSPPLTTVGRATLDFSILADLLFSRMEDRSLEERIYTLQWQLILRGSA